MGLFSIVARTFHSSSYFSEFLNENKKINQNDLSNQGHKYLMGILW
jgi:hypothetical protein